MKLKGKVAVVTGASGGIGSMLVKSLDKEGVQCALVARNKEKLSLLVKDLSGKNHKIYASDFTDNTSIENAVKEIKKDFDKVDILINAAGYGVYKPIEEVSFKEWEDSFSIGVTGAYFVTKLLLPAIEKSDISLVLNMGSGAGVIPMAGRSVYNVQKYAVRGMTLGLAEEFQRTKTHFCLITLGSTLTDFGPLTLKEKEEEHLKGKAYFTPRWVAKKLTEIIKDEKRDVEYTLYPSEYVGGSWKPPESTKE